MENLIFEPPLHLFHLSGGLRLLAGNNQLCWLMDKFSATMLVYSTLGDASDALSGYPSIQILGRNRFDQAEELNESIAQAFSIHGGDDTESFRAFSHHTHWSGVSNRLRIDGMIDEALMAQRVSTQIFKSTRRFEKLSKAYQVARDASHPPKAHSISFSQDKYAADIGSEFGSLLDDLYATRDAINALALRLHFQDSGNFQTKKFRARVLNSLESPMSKIIAGSMFCSEMGDMLISKMSTYRGVALHCLGTSNPITKDSTMIKSEGGPFGVLNRVIYPLYDDMEELTRIEKGQPTASRGSESAEFRRFAMLPEHTDALDFSHKCLLRLLKIAELLADALGIEPQALQITEKDILKMEYTDDAGRRVRLERDLLSGELVETILE